MTPKIKARQMWMQHGLEIDHVIGSRRQLHTCNPSRIFKNDIPVAVIPIDQPEALVRSFADAIYHALFAQVIAELGGPEEPTPQMLADARYVLEQHGILTKPTTKRKGGK